MGICAIQHRMAIGKYNSKFTLTINKNNISSYRLNELNGNAVNVLNNTCCVVFLMVYIYVICLLMALLIKTSLNKYYFLPATGTHPTLKITSFREVFKYMLSGYYI